MLFFSHSFHFSLLLPYDVLAKSLVSCQVFSKKMVPFYYLFDRSITDHSLESALSAQQLVLLKKPTGTICAYL